MGVFPGRSGDGGNAAAYLPAGSGGLVYHHRPEGDDAIEAGFLWGIDSGTGYSYRFEPLPSQFPEVIVQGPGGGRIAGNGAVGEGVDLKGGEGAVHLRIRRFSVDPDTLGD